MNVLYDGSPLVFHPNSPAALHLLTLLAAHPVDFPALVGLPGESFESLPPSVKIFTDPLPDTDWGRLRWEQRILPALAARTSVRLVHNVGDGSALFGSARTLVSPAGFWQEDFSVGGPRLRFADRLHRALSQGGLARANALLWPDDLPVSKMSAPVYRLPPAVHPIFGRDPLVSRGSQSDAHQLEALNLPETYLLYHGPGDDLSLRRLLDSWSWAAGPIGASFPLILAGLDRPAQDRLAALLAEYQLTDTSRPLPVLSLSSLAAVYQGCSALFHPTPIAIWGDPVRLALACSKPVVALDDERTAALVGPAGYLISPGQTYPQMCRALGAALISVAVEESLADALGQMARQRAAAWSFDSFAFGLKECYRAQVS